MPRIIYALLLLTGLWPTATAAKRPVGTKLQGPLSPGCVSLDSVKLCRKAESATLLVNRRATRFFDGLLADNQSSYLLRRGPGYYEVGVGRPGTSADPMAIRYSVEIKPSAKGIELRRILAGGTLNCDGTKVPYSYAIDFGSKMVVYEVETSRGLRRHAYRLRQSIGNPTSISFDRHLALIASLNVNDRTLCAS
jgi:hypothetical protein